MDITDPEQDPTLIAEITDPTGNMGSTTASPAKLNSCGLSADAKNPNKVDTIIDAVSLGDGVATSPVLHRGSGAHAGENQTVVMTQSSTGAVTRTAITIAPAATSGEIDWREMRP